MNKTLFIVRHAHRDKERGASFDNGLSEKGQKQAKKLKKFFEEKYAEKIKGEIKFQIFSSPKKRCIETVAPIAEAFGLQVEINPLLAEGEPIEIKVSEFYKWWASKAGLYTMVSSHGDWIPHALLTLTGARAEVRKGSFAEITGSSATPYLVTLIQEF